MNFMKIIIEFKYRIIEFYKIIYIWCNITRSTLNFKKFVKLKSIVREVNNLCEFNYKAFYYKATYVSIGWYQKGGSILNMYMYVCDRSYKSITN